MYSAKGNKCVTLLTKNDALAKYLMFRSLIRGVGRIDIFGFSYQLLNWSALFYREIYAKTWNGFMRSIQHYDSSRVNTKINL